MRSRPRQSPFAGGNQGEATSCPKTMSSTLALSVKIVIQLLMIKYQHNAVKKSLQIPTGYLESVNWRSTDNIMAKGKRANG